MVESRSKVLVVAGQGLLQVEVQLLVGRPECIELAAALRSRAGYADGNMHKRHEH